MLWANNKYELNKQMSVTRKFFPATREIVYEIEKCLKKNENGNDTNKKITRIIDTRIDI